MLKKFIALPLAALLLAGAVISASADNVNITKTSVQIKTVNFTKVSSKKIKLKWSDGKDPMVKTYLLQRYNDSSKKWTTIAKVSSDGKKGNNTYSYTDVLSSSAPQQYKYRVNVKVSNSDMYKAVNGVSAYASNIKVCIDPGHFAGKNGGTYGYFEGDATIKIALEMRDLLKKEGIGTYLTRTDGNITVGGQTNVDDGSQLVARAKTAKANKCDMFLSVHTNANNANANGRDTVNQPNNLNKTVIFVNYTAYSRGANSPVVIAANKAGGYITSVNQQLGIPTNSWQGLKSGRPYTYCTTVAYETVDTDAFIAYNDKVKQKGRVIFRSLNNRSNDYYAVLRAATADGVPGMLIEHSYHTVPAFCKKFMSTKYVAKYYALADAKAIGQGYGFKTLSKLP